MTLRPTDYALLSQNAYQQPDLGSRVTLDGVDYKPMDYANDPRTGFQATAYDHTNSDGSHSVVIAYRGTEFGREPVQDGVVDAGMVLAGVNLQGPDSEAFTKRVMDKAHADAAKFGYQTDITVTGHSLGGTLAEMNAYKYGLHGETFNAYGAAGLALGIPQGGHQVIDNVRATDVVSAGAAHFGEVRTYAAPQDIDVLSKAGYSDSQVVNALSFHSPILGAIQKDAHAIENFVPNNKLLGDSIITPANAQRYETHHVMVDRYRNEIQAARVVASADWEIPNTLVRTGLAIDHAVAEKVTQGAHAVANASADAAHFAEREAVKGYDATRAGVVSGVHAVERGYDATVSAASHGVDATVHGVKVVEGIGARAYHAQVEATSRGLEAMADHLKTPSVHLDHPAHPDHPLYQQSLSAVHRLDAQNGRTPDQHSANLAGAVTVGARANGLNKVDHVALSDDGSKAFAVQGDLRSPLKQVANGIDTAQAVNTPVAQSSAGWSQAMQQHQQQHAQTHAQPQLQRHQQEQLVPQQSNPVTPQ